MLKHIDIHDGPRAQNGTKFSNYLGQVKRYLVKKGCKPTRDEVDVISRELLDRDTWGIENGRLVIIKDY